MKRKIALVAVLVGALVLCSCGMGGIEDKALKYLANRYSGEFTIISAERESDVTGPIPVFHSTSHWVLTVVSDRFPDDTFELRYGRNAKDDGRTWSWTDNYYALLFRDEPAAVCEELAKEFFGADCIAKAPVFQEGWPDGVGENSTLQEWVQAGGSIMDVTIWFCDFLPNDDEFIAFADALTEKLPIEISIKCRGLTAEGYQAVSEQQDLLNTIWKEHRDWISGRIDYSLESRKIVLSQRYFAD